MANTSMEILKEELRKRKAIYAEESKNLGELTLEGAFIRGKAISLLDILYEIHRIESG